MSRVKKNVLDRFYEKVVMGNNGCWQWIACKSVSGYGWFNDGIKNMRAHRYSYLVFKGDIPSNLVIDHICRNRLCVNPAHLRLVTTRENLLCGNTFAANNKLKTHCVKGHGFTEENTYNYISRGNPSRGCKECKNMWRPKIIINF